MFLLGVLFAGMVVAAQMMLLRSTTGYAPGYSERRFRDVKPGASADQIYTLLGDPLRKLTNDHGIVWYYTEPRGSFLGVWHVRSVTMSNNVVVAKFNRTVD